MYTISYKGMFIIWGIYPRLVHFSCVWRFVTHWIGVHQAPLSVGFSRQEYWSEVPFPPPGDLPTPGTEPKSLTFPMSSALASRFFTTSITWEARMEVSLCDPKDCTVHGILQAKILQWVAFPFSMGSSQPTDRTQVSHMAGGFFTSWATQEAQLVVLSG